MMGSSYDVQFFFWVGVGRYDIICVKQAVFFVGGCVWEEWFLF